MDRTRPRRSIADERSIRLQRESGIAEIAISQPARRNAMSRGMWVELAEVVRELDPATRAVIVSGSGAEAFSAGADISEFADAYRDREAAADYSRIVSDGQRALAACPVPVIAAIEGVCFGGGCGIALAADLRFAGRDARFAITPAKIGAAYSFADTRQLVDIVGPSRAKDMLFSGRVLDAEEALRIGLIDRLVETGGALGAARAYAADIAGLSRVSHAVTKRTIEAIRAGADAPDEALERAHLDAFEAADFREGYGAFLAKRRPRFS